MNLLIRADANHKIGNGHIMRCIALAQTCKDRGGSVTFLSCCDSNSLRQRIIDEGFEFFRIEKSCPEPSDIDTVLKKISTISQQKVNDTWFVLDGYHFNSVYQRAIREAGHRLMVIDDTAHLDKYFADIVLNQNINADRLNYTVEPRARLLLGPRYVLLRTEFIEQSVRFSKNSKIARKLLVTLGGGDSGNLTLKVIEAIERVKIDGLEAMIVVGPVNPHLQQLQAKINSSTVPMHLKVNTTRMAELMAWADMAVTAGGSTCWELACMGLPALVIILAENQCAVANGLEERGAVINLGWHHDLTSVKIAHTLEDLLLNSAKREKMAEIIRKLVDGKGTERVLSNLVQQ